jgi:hypothetical protein
VYFVRDDAAYALARHLDGQPDVPVYDYRTTSKVLGFYARQRYLTIDALTAIEPPHAGDCFILTDEADVGHVLETMPGSQVVARAVGTATNRLAPRMFNHTRWYPNVAAVQLALVRTGGH